MSQDFNSLVILYNGALMSFESLDLTTLFRKNHRKTFPPLTSALISTTRTMSVYLRRNCWTISVLILIREFLGPRWPTYSYHALMLINNRGGQPTSRAALITLLGGCYKAAFCHDHVARQLSPLYFIESPPEILPWLGVNRISLDHDLFTRMSELANRYNKRFVEDPWTEIMYSEDVPQLDWRTAFTRAERSRIEAKRFLLADERSALESLRFRPEDPRSRWRWGMCRSCFRAETCSNSPACIS